MGYAGGGFIERGLDFTRRKKRWVILLGLIGFSSYGAYKVYHMPSFSRKRRRILKLLDSLVSMAEMVTDSAETISVVSRDLKEFLNSDSDEIPTSLKQLSKIARSEEFSQSVISVSQAMTSGILRGCKGESSTMIQSDGLSFPDRVMDKLMSSAGTGFVSVVVGSFARNLVLGFYGDVGTGKTLSEDIQLGSHSSLSLPMWITVLLDDRSRALIADCIQTFVSTAVAVYLDKTMHINFIDDLLSSLTDPKHQNKVAEILVSLCNGAVESLVKTAHEVLTTSKQGPVLGSSHSVSIVDDTESVSYEEKMGYSDLKSNGWVNSVSSTLAVPSNRKLVLDVTGRVAFETTRSMAQLFWSKAFECLKRNMNVAHNEVVVRGFEVVSYVGAKSSVILTVCLAFLLHIIADSRVLAPL